MGANLRPALATVKDPGYDDVAVLDPVAKDIAIAAEVDPQLSNGAPDGSPSFGKMFERKIPRAMASIALSAADGFTSASQS
jgi:hypothetical protein